MLLVREPGNMVVAGVGDVFINVWRGGANIPLLEKLRAAEKRFAERASGRMVVFTVMEATSFEHIMTAPEREFASNIARDLAPQTRALAYTFEGGGFLVAVARAAIAGISLFSRSKHPSKTFSVVADAAKWSAQVAEGVDAATVVRAVSEARDALVNP